MSRHRWSVGRAIGVAAAAIAGVAGYAVAAAAATTAWTTVTIRVYDGARLPAVTRTAALAQTATALASAAIDPVWQVCGARDVSDDAACSRPLGPGELAVRVVRLPVPQGHTGALPLGDALIDARSGGSVLATIYLDRVVWLARAAGADADVLLGRAIAHELGHLLMATVAHAARGLMRPHWSRDDLRRNRDGDWDFARADVAAMTARRAAAGTAR